MRSMPTFIATIPFSPRQTSLRRCELFLMIQNSNPSWSWTDANTHRWFIDCELVSSWTLWIWADGCGANHYQNGTRRAGPLAESGSAGIPRNHGVRPNVLRSHDGETTRWPVGTQA